MFNFYTLVFERLCGGVEATLSGEIKIQKFDKITETIIFKTIHKEKFSYDLGLTRIKQRNKFFKKRYSDVLKLGLRIKM